MAATLAAPKFQVNPGWCMFEHFIRVMSRVSWCSWRCCYRCRSRLRLRLALRRCLRLRCCLSLRFCLRFRPSLWLRPCLCLRHRCTTSCRSIKCCLGSLGHHLDGIQNLWREVLPLDLDQVIVVTGLQGRPIEYDLQILQGLDHHH